MKSRLLFLLLIFAYALIPMSIPDSYGEIPSSDRRIDWSPGIPGGIPDYPIGINVKDAPYNAAGDGVTDDRTAIQSALSACSSGKAVYLPAGTYRITSSLTVPSNVVLRGAGPSQTIILVDSTGSGSHGIKMRGYSPAPRADLELIPSRGDTTITVSDASKITVNDIILLRHDSDHIASGTHTGADNSATLTDSSKSWSNNELVGCMIRNLQRTEGFIIGNRGDIESRGEITANTSNTVTVTLSGDDDNDWDTGDSCFIYPKDNAYTQHDYGYIDFPDFYHGHEAQFFKVTNKAGAVLTLSRPIYATYVPAMTPKVYELWEYTINAGVEDLKITYVNNNSGSYNVLMSSSVYCWLKNVESYNAVSRHVYILYSFGCEIRDSYFHHSNGNNYGSGRGYGVNIIDNNSDHLIENNIFYYLRHSVIFSSGGMGCVVGYNYSYRMFDSNYPSDNTLTLDMMTHGTQPAHNLFEGNVCQKMGLDNVFGGSAYMTFFRNWSRRFCERADNGQDVTRGLWAVQVDAHNIYSSFIGNVLGRTGDTGDIWKLGCNNAWACAWTDDDSSDTLLRHGNYDYVSDTVQWDPGIADHNIPNSLYHDSKPSFFRNDEAWPPFGPDIPGYVNIIPAHRRFSAPSPP